MANSRLSYLTKIRNGVLFHETFENDDFLNAQGWDQLQGNPATATTQARAGIKSWNNATTGLPPVARKILDTTEVDPGSWMVSVWFYDDASKTDDIQWPGPYLQIETAEGKFFKMGVRNGVSTTDYCASTSALNADDFEAMTAPRQDGWKRIDFYYIDGFCRGYIYYPNGSSAILGTYSLSTTDVPIEVSLRAAKVGENTSSFGYFDELNVFKSMNLKIVAPDIDDRSVLFYRTDATLGGFGPTSSPITPGLYPDIIAAQIGVPFSPRNSFRSGFSGMNPGDIFQFNEINFGRKVGTYQPQPTSLTNRAISPSGLVKSFTFALKDELTFNLQALPSIFESQATNWFEHARHGNSFSLLVDDEKDGAFGTVSVAASIDDGGTVTIADVVDAISTEAFIEGERYVLRSTDNKSKQILTLASKTDTTLTFVDNFRFLPKVGDYVYSEHFYPFMEMPGEQLGFKISEPKTPLYVWSQTISDWNNG